MKFVKKIIIFIVVFMIVLSNTFGESNIVFATDDVEYFITNFWNGNVIHTDGPYSATYKKYDEDGVTVLDEKTKTTTESYYVKVATERDIAGIYGDLYKYVIEDGLDAATINDEITLKRDNKEYTKTRAEWLLWISSCLHVSSYDLQGWTKDPDTYAFDQINEAIDTMVETGALTEETEKEAEDLKEDVNDTSEVVETWSEEEEKKDDEDDSDVGGVLLGPIVAFINVLLDGVQTVLTFFLRNEVGWRDVLVGRKFATSFGSNAVQDNKKRVIQETSNETRHVIWYYDRSGNGEFDNEDQKLLDITGSKEKFDGWKGNIDGDTEGYSNAEILAKEDEYVSGSDLEDYDGSLGGNEFFIDATTFKPSYAYPQIAYSPEEIFAGDIDLLNANFFKTDGINEESNFEKIRQVIIVWFRALRYLGLVGLLAILIYTGIKIMTSSVASDKAKYKERIVNWVVAVVIMFLLPYIMTFIFTVADKLIDLFNNDGVENPITVYVYDAAAGNGSWETTLLDLPIVRWFADRINSVTVNVHGHKYTYTKFTTNLMGLVRFQIQSRNVTKMISYEVMYIMMVVFTIRFTIIYLKRMLYVAFLTMISPIVAMMYPIDKMGDGRSQSFEQWLKEYIFNALLQPLHMLIYYIFVTSAMSFATKNIIYVLVVFGFMTQAEKILKQIFGFQAPMGTVGGLSGSAATAMTLSALTNTASTVSNLFRNSDKTLGGGKGEDSTETPSSSSIPDYSNFPGVSATTNQEGESVDVSPEVLVAEADRDMAIDTAGNDIHDYLDNSETGMLAPEETEAQKLAGTFSDAENLKLAELVDQGMNPDEAIDQIMNVRDFSNDEKQRLEELKAQGLSENDAINQIMAERARLPKLPDNINAMKTFTDKEHGLYQELLDKGITPDDAVSQIIRNRPERITNNGDSNATPPQINEPKDVTPNKFTAKKGTAQALGLMAQRRINKARYFVDHLDRRKVIKGVAKVGGFVGAAGIGAGAVLTQAAISLAMDGKYNPLEGVATFAGATIATNKLLGVAGNATMDLYDEMNTIKLGEEVAKSKQRTREFFNDKKKRDAYLKKYGDMGYAKVAEEMERGARLQAKGVTSLQDQMEVAAYTDSLVNKEFNRKYKDYSDEQIHEIADQIRERAISNNDKNMAQLSDKDIIRVNLRNAVNTEGGKTYEDIAIETLKARNDIGNEIIYATKDKQEAWIKGFANGNEAVEQGVRQAIENCKEMNLANRSDKERMKELQLEYDQYNSTKKEVKQIQEARNNSASIEEARRVAKIKAEEAADRREKAEQAYKVAGKDSGISKEDNQYQKRQAEIEFDRARKEADQAMSEQLVAMQNEAKNNVKIGKVSQDEEVQEWQMALTALNLAKANGGKLTKDMLQQELSKKYSSSLGTNVEAVTKKTIKTLEKAGCIDKTAKSTKTITASSGIATRQLNSFMKKHIKSKKSK